MQKSLENFTGLYSLSKTLKFELKPIGKTLENIQKNGLLTEDEQRADKYKKVKKIIDEYHKYFIDQALQNVELEDLNEYRDCYKKGSKEEADIKIFEAIKIKLRKQVASFFKKDERFKNLFAKELIKEDLINWINNNEDKSIVNDFKTFTTYFTGFHENRKNMYTDEEKSTAIAFRLIHQNLPKFIDNISLYEKAKNVGVDFSSLETDLDEVIQGTPLDEIFSLAYFNQVLNQTGIDLYNTVLGGKSEDNQKKKKGLNEYINLFNQKQEDKRNKIPQLKPLYKQILSDKDSVSFLLEEFENDQQLLETIDQFYISGIIHKTYDKEKKTTNILHEIKDLLSNLSEYNTNLIYINNDTTLTNISQKIFGSWEYIPKALKHYWIEVDKIKSVKEQEKREKQKYYSIEFVEKALIEYKKTESNEDLLKRYTNHPINDYFNALGLNVETEKNLIQNIEENYELVKDLLNSEFRKEESLAQQKDKTTQIKQFLDAILELLHFIKALRPKVEISEKDEAFYGEFDKLYDVLNVITPLYNKVRNHLTKKLYSTDKFKLNFENSTLLDGWDVNKEDANTSILFEKSGMFYLGIMKKEHNKIFKKIPTPKTKEIYQKVNYKLLPGASKMLPKVFFSAKNISFYNPSEEILEIRNTGSHTKNGNAQEGYSKKEFNVHDCRKIIDFFKSSINNHPEWKDFGFVFSPTNSYESIDSFYREVEGQGYNITYTPIDNNILNEYVDQGKLYLFQIYNKDFSPNSKGTPNLHTLYWKTLFDEQNLKDVVFKLNGQAEIFYRKQSIQPKNTIVHKANQAIDNKNPLNKKAQSTFTYNIVKDKRFTVDKFQFHVPITLNFKALGINNINTTVNEYLQTHPNTHIIGLDRGERHLLYLSLINPKGEIVKQFSLNEIVNQHKGNTYKTNYHDLLDKKEGDRLEARKDWGTIENIKELKEGYLSQVVHKIAELVVEYNAVVVMEDLNSGFKNSRIKVEKQVYQKFEKMLIDKFNFLAFKNPNDGQPSIYNALQIANKFESFSKMGKQNGFIFYVPAWNTSKIDPATGFVDFLKPKFESVEKAQKFFQKFDSIRFNKSKERFEFDMDYNNFTERAEDTQTKWTICADNQIRYRWNKSLNQNKGAQEKILAAQTLEDLFGKYQISYGSGENILNQIVEQNNKDFFVEFIRVLQTVLSLRHNNGLKDDKEEDYILSPVEPFFDSRKATSQQPDNADANGAYHIAKKGLVLLERLKNKGVDEFEKSKRSKDGKSQWLPNKEWLNFVQAKK